MHFSCFSHFISCLLTNEINLAISKVAHSSDPILLSGSLKLEIESWIFLDSWEGVVPWRSEFPHHIVPYSDASPFGWGAVLTPDVKSVTLWDDWPSSLHTNCWEILALCNTLESLLPTVSNSWVDVFTDSRVLLKPWHYQGTESQSLLTLFKHLFATVSSSNIHLNLFLISSSLSVADLLSRSLSLQDSKFS